MWTEAQLDSELSRPSEALIRDMNQLDGDILVLGAGGKVGPTLSVMAKRASAGNGRRVYAASRFSDPYALKLMQSAGVETIRIDLTDADQLSKLPKVKNIVFLAGRKFGTSENACETWEMNVAVPSRVTRYFGDARYVVFSTGNVYPFTSASGGGCGEDTPPAPVGEYGMSSLGRERMFEYAASHFGAKALIYRLNYAVDLRYGVLYDLGVRVLNGECVSVRVPAFNCVWQGYANEVALRSLLLCESPAAYLNVTGTETVYVRDAALAFAKALKRDVSFEGEPGDTALLSCADKCAKRFGAPEYSANELIRLQAEWLLSGGRHLDKPTHFEEARGRF